MGGLCFDCQVERMTKSAKHLAAREGRYYDEWKRGMAAWLRDLDVTG